jgi:tetratricopeptide (TPR) repeat protein/V8-like Glu-specific endopeptidase
MLIFRPTACLAIFGALMTIAPPGMALPASQVAEISKNVTVAIQTDGSLGSGVIIHKAGNKYTVLTAAHVVRSSASYQIVTADDRRHALNYRTVKMLPGADLALLEFTSTQNHAVVKIGRMPSTGKNVYVGGFPLNTAAITRSVFNFTEGKVTARSSKPLKDGYGLIYTNLTLPGMSGGSVLNEKGELVAIHGKGDVDSKTSPTVNSQVRLKTGFNLGIPADTFVPLVRTAGLPISQASISTIGSTEDSSDLVEAAILRQNGDYNGALVLLNRVIASRPQAAAYYMRANINMSLGDTSRVIDDLNRAIELDSRNASAYMLRGNMLYANKDWAGAIADFDRVIQLEPKYIQAYTLKAVTQWVINDLTGVLNTYNALIKVDPQNVGAYQMRVAVKNQLNDRAGAIADLSQIIRISPKNIEAYMTRASFLYWSKDFQGAIADYSKVISLNPNSLAAYEARIGIYMEQGNMSAALADCQAMLKINPRSQNAYDKQIEIYGKQNNDRGIIAALTGLIGIDPNQAYNYGRRGEVHQRLKNKAQALADYRRAAQLYQQQGNKSDADRMNEQIRELSQGSR